MADTIPDLWSTSDLKTAVLTPVAILRAQATLLGKKTQGLLVGDVRIVTSEKGQSILSFDVVAPAVNNYRFSLLNVKHARDASYPAEISAQGFTISKTLKSISPFHSDQTITTSVSSKTAYSDTEFIRLLQEVLQAPETIARLQSLIVRSNEEAVDPASMEDENVEQSDEQEE